MEDVNWTLVILLTTVGFFTLAAILLLPVYVFLKREEGISKLWTPEAIARRQRENAGGRPVSAPPTDAGSTDAPEARPAHPPQDA
ncbi:MAG: hypothetical protein AAFQ43_05415 [Bacteroidota bacterium]